MKNKNYSQGQKKESQNDSNKVEATQSKAPSNEGAIKALRDKIVTEARKIAKRTVLNTHTLTVLCQELDSLEQEIEDTRRTA